MFNRNSEKRKRLKIIKKNIPENKLGGESPTNIEPNKGVVDDNTNTDNIDTNVNQEKEFGESKSDANEKNIFSHEENPFAKQQKEEIKEEPTKKVKEEPVNREPTSNLEEDKKENTFEGEPPSVVDSDTTYFFVFGLGSAGKSVMLSGLIYYLSAFHEKGQIKSTGDRNTENHKRGDAILSKMRRKVKNGEFVDRSRQIDKNEFVFPSEIHLKYVPSISENRYEMPFCLLEMAGEDLKEIKLRDDGRSGGKFDERINSYLMHPNCSIAFICVVDPDDLDESEQVIVEFLTYTEKIGRITNPVLIAVSKWDRFKEEYNNNVDEYFDANIKSLDRITQDEDREFTKMGFSIGNVSEDNTKYEFIPSDSEKLFKWMYEIAIGVPFNQEITPSFFSKIGSSIKSIFTK